MEETLSNSGSNSPIPESYYTPQTNMDMSSVGKSATSKNGNLIRGTTYTVNGSPRNNVAFWNNVLDNHPEMLSPANIAKIKNGASPTVDDVWVAYNPQHANFMEEKLIHHHIGQGKIATAIPESLHQKWNKVLHPFRRTNLKSPTLKSTGRFLGGLVTFLNLLVEIGSDNPYTIKNLTFGNGANVGQIYKNPEEGTDSFYMITSQEKIYSQDGKTLLKVIRHVELYESFGRDDNGNYFGIGKYDSGRIVYDYQNKTFDITSDKIY